jgi:hypothetical protein
MKLGDVQKEIDAYSKSASDGVRQLALAGIAVIWLFKTAKPEAAGIPFSDVLLNPLLGFVAALGLDLLQYVLSAIAWWLFFKSKDGSGVTRESEVGKAWSLINLPGTICFFAKIVAVAAAYVILILYIAQRL